MKKFMIKTVILQEIQTPDYAVDDDVLNFLAEFQSFRGAFCGIGTDGGEFRIVDVSVESEEIV